MEAEHAFTSRFSVAGLIETGRDPISARRVNALAIEGLYALGKLKPFDVDSALYAELKHGLRGEPDAVEVKALFQHNAGRFDSRLNLIAERPLRLNEPTEFGYAASIDWAVADELRLGLPAFGDLGTSRHLIGRQERVAGPEVKYDIEHVGPAEIEVEVGWLRAFGAARDETKGQVRLLIGYEFHI